ncbi:SOS response-associated peptidase [Rhizobium lentis]|uniref:SOS response-associated peptidase n=1 Tax=Rhizobium lentis TaxID=1138194 RepID=UPI001C83A078|nr:SOS response-associated peptidase [Rhizobium lentis]MBX5136449.1 SOS response-associated peptidase [Rhizobium lentis]MBX5142131.1 SOS response-associated peptidase [Rhizobium lentis]MBX5179649.1 SOS response-associated peptidase [Rhizobium lentis]
MASRVYIKDSLHELARHFDFAGEGELEALADCLPRYNGAPRQVYPIVIQDKLRERGSIAPVFAAAVWGLVPAVTKPSDRRLPLINVRCENIATHGLTGPAYRSRRCLIPVSGFFEWNHISPGRAKQPYAIAMNSDLPFALAGIWESWRHPAGIDIRSFAVITCPSNEIMKTISERMPVILGRQDYERWLSPDPNPANLMKGYPAELMTIWPIGMSVNSPRNTGPEIIDPIVWHPKLGRGS